MCYCISMGIYHLYLTLFRKYGSGAFISSVLATDSHIHLFFVLCFCIAMANAVDVTAVVVGIRHFFAKI